MTSKILNSAIEAIGDTPLVRLSRFGARLDGTILAKLDYFNPGFSKKDRIARQIIEDAEADGLLSPGQKPRQAIVEHTSGNTGTGLAIVSAVRGYRFIAVMSKGNTQERARMMRGLGAEVVLVDQAPSSTPGQVSGEDWQLVEEETIRQIDKHKAFHVSQFVRQGNFRAHYLHTGPEIIADSNGAIDGYCDFVGSGGTFAGTARALKEHNSSIQCFVVEPKGAAVLAGEDVTGPGHPIQGGGYSMTDLAQLRAEDIDGFMKVTDDEAIDATRRLAAEEGIFAGVSSGANVAAAAQLLAGPMKGKTVVTLINDSGLKYLSTDLWA